MIMLRNAFKKRRGFTTQTMPTTARLNKQKAEVQT
jgi:hypothetical protein